MRTVFIAIVAVCWISTPGSPSQPDPKYVPTGEPDSVQLEEALYEILPGYVDGIRPNVEILKRGIPQERLPEARVRKVKERLTKTLKVNLQPKTREKFVMVGIPKLRCKSDFIVGYLSCDSCDAPDRSQAVEFQANFWGIGLTIHSQGVTIGDGSLPSAQEIVTIISRYLDIPNDKIPLFTVEHHVLEVNKSRLCYGKLRCEWNERTSPLQDQKWWSYIPFWMMDGIVYVYVPEVEWEGGSLPANANSTWDLLKEQTRDGK